MEGRHKFYKDFKRLGSLLFQQGLVSLTAGNLSVRKGDHIYITASGSMLGDLQYEDITHLSVSGARTVEPVSLKKPSIESIVHSAIYKGTSHNAIAHVHAPAAIAISFNKDRIMLADSEGKFYVPEAPVIAVNGGIASEDVARELPPLLAQYPAVIVRGHGLFTAAEFLKDACSIASTVEFSSRILLYMEQGTFA